MVNLIKVDFRPIGFLLASIEGFYGAKTPLGSPIPGDQSNLISSKVKIQSSYRLSPFVSAK